MKPPAYLKVAVLTVLLAVAAQARPDPPLPKQTWRSGETDVILSHDGTTLRVSATTVTLMPDGTLRIGTEGPMGNNNPWRDACSSVTRLIIEEGVTKAHWYGIRREGRAFLTKSRAARWKSAIPRLRAAPA